MSVSEINVCRPYESQDALVYANNRAVLSLVQKKNKEHTDVRLVLGGKLREIEHLEDSKTLHWVFGTKEESEFKPESMRSSLFFDFHDQRNLRKLSKKMFNQIILKDPNIRDDFLDSLRNTNMFFKSLLRLLKDEGELFLIDPTSRISSDPIVYSEDSLKKYFNNVESIEAKNVFDGGVGRYFKVSQRINYGELFTSDRQVQDILLDYVNQGIIPLLENKLNYPSFSRMTVSLNKIGALNLTPLEARAFFTALKMVEDKFPRKPLKMSLIYLFTKQVDEFKNFDNLPEKKPCEQLQAGSAFRPSARLTRRLRQPTLPITVYPQLIVRGMHDCKARIENVEVAGKDLIFLVEVLTSLYTYLPEKNQLGRRALYNELVQWLNEVKAS